MLSELSLSARSQTLYTKLLEYCRVHVSQDAPLLFDDLQALSLQVDEGHLSFSVLLDWLCRSYSLDKKACFLCESLRCSLFKDLNAQWSQEQGVDLTIDEPAEDSEGHYTPLLVAGVTLVACEGFDGIATVLGVFPSISTACVFSVGLVCSMSSLLIYYGLDLLMVSNAFGVSLNNSREMLELSSHQTKLIKALRHRISEFCDSPQDKETLAQFALFSSMLSLRFNAQDEARQFFISGLQNPSFRFVRTLTTSFLGLLFFCGGFGAGQTVGLVFTELASMTAVLATTVTISLSVLAGLAALAVYYYVERYDIEAIVSRCFGLDTAQIADFTEPQCVERERHQLARLQHRVEHQLSLVGQAHLLATRLAHYEQVPEDAEAILPAPIPRLTTDAGRFFHHTRRYSEADLPFAFSPGL